jgi:hypothetical protein
MEIKEAKIITMFNAFLRSVADNWWLASNGNSLFNKAFTIIKNPVRPIARFVPARDPGIIIAHKKQLTRWSS